MTNNNSAYQRGASRYQQPQLPIEKKGVPGWVWMISGMLLGTAAVFLVTTFKSGSLVTAPSPEVAEPVAEGTSKSLAPAPAVDEAQPSKPKFDFYTLLPDSKVIVPPGAEEEPSAPPPFRNKEESNDSLLSNVAPAAAVALAPAAVALASKAMQGQSNPNSAAVNSAANPTASKLTPAPASSAHAKLAPAAVSKPTSQAPLSNGTVALKPLAPAVTVTTNTAASRVNTAPAPTAVTSASAKPVAAPKVVLPSPAPVKTPPTTPQSLASVNKLTPAAPTVASAPSVSSAPKPSASPTPPPAPQQPVVSTAPVTSVKPVASTPTPAPTLAKVQPTPSPAPTPVTKPQQLFLQAGSFRKSDDADRVRAEMLLIGVNARIETTQSHGETVHRVLVGPYSNSEKMAQAQKQLSENGYSHLVPQKR